MRAADVLQRYIDEGLPEFIEVVLTHVNQRGTFGNTPLHVACTRGALEEVEALLADGAEVNAKGETGDTPLFRAAQQDHVAVVQRLLEMGALPDLANDYGSTPRQVAALLEQQDVLDTIDTWCKSKGMGSP